MDVKSINALGEKMSQNEMKKIGTCFFEACESEKHESNELIFRFVHNCLPQRCIRTRENSTKRVIIQCNSMQRQGLFY